MGIAFSRKALSICERSCKNDKSLEVRDVGVDCDFVARGATAEEVMEKARRYALADHGLTSIPSEMADKAKAAIHDEESAKA